MKKFAYAATLVSFLAMSACSGAQVSSDISNLTPIGACVLTQVESGADPMAVLVACAGTTIEQIIKIVQTYLAASADAGVAAKRDLYTNFLNKALALQPAGAK